MLVLVVDNYDSFVYNLVQYIGELGGIPKVYRNNQITLKIAEKLKPERIIISPGPGSPDNPRFFGQSLKILESLSKKIPTLGVCLGHQGIIYAFGGKIINARKLMHGKTSLIKHDGKSIFKGLNNPFEATRYHSLVGQLSSIPSCLKITAESLDDYEIMAVRHKKFPIEGVQFHPESILTLEGKRLIKNFLDEGVKND